MLRNTADQRWRVFAFYRATNIPYTGGAASITGKLSLDYANTQATADVNPTEIEDGYYYFNLEQAETDAHNIEIYPESSTSGVQVIGIPGSYVTQLAEATENPALTDPSLEQFSEAYGPKKVQTPNMTVEQFSPLEIQRARDRESAAYPTLGSMHVTIASPDHCKYYEKRKSR